MGKYGLPPHNENGDLLTELCGKHGLPIGGTLPPHRLPQDNLCGPCISRKNSKSNRPYLHQPEMEKVTP
jgi:hypothetical protein